jgi:Putative peptidoglycan binding domain
MMMVGRDEPRGTAIDPDDWFAGAGSDLLEEPQERTAGDARTRERASAGTAEPGWLEDADGAEAELAPPPGRFAGSARGRLAAVGVGVVALSLIVLAASGVFSGNGGSSSPAPTTNRQVTTASPAQTPPVTPTPSAPATSLPAAVLKPDATGADVKTVQRALASAGHSPGPVDGIYGPKTEQTISDFQRSAGITVDGIYGPETQKALEDTLNSG